LSIQYYCNCPVPEPDDTGGTHCGRCNQQISGLLSPLPNRIELGVMNPDDRESQFLLMDNENAWFEFHAKKMRFTDGELCLEFKEPFLKSMPKKLRFEIAGHIFDYELQ